MSGADRTISRAALEAAGRIGTSLLERAVRQDGGLTWLCPDPPPRRGDPVPWRPLESLYDGTAGIALFLGELTAVTGEARFRAATDDAVRWLLSRCREPSPGPSGLYVGRASVAYFLTRWGAIQRDRTLLDRACEIALDAAGVTPAPGVPRDLLGGGAGRALVLAHLRSAVRDPAIDTILDRELTRFVDEAARTARTGPAGLYWDRFGFCVHGLCGVAHGAAGAGMALLEVGRLLRHPGAPWLARQAFLYEEARFEEAGIGTWPDLRRDEVFQDVEAHLAAGGVPSALSEPRAMTGWCNGASGIGLTRLRAFDLLGDDAHRVQAERALEIVERSLERRGFPADLSLCHGRCGEADLFVQAAATWSRPDLRAIAIRETEALLRAERDRPEVWFEASSRPELVGDPGLLLGAAGIGHFLLRMATGATVPSVLAPVVPALPATDLGATPDRPSGTLVAVRRAIFRSTFPGVMELLERSPDSASALDDGLAEEDGSSLAAGWEERFLDRAAGLLPPERAPVIDLERRKRALDAQVENDALLTFEAIARRRSAERLEALRDDQLLALRLRMRPELEIWQPDQEGAPPRLLEPTGVGVREIPLPPLALAVLEGYRDGRDGTAVVAAIESRLGTAKEDRPALRHRVAEQARAALARGLLEEVP